MATKKKSKRNGKKETWRDWVTVTVRLPRKVRDTAHRVAKREHLSLSALIRGMVATMSKVAAKPGGPLARRA